MTRYRDSWSDYSSSGFPVKWLYLGIFIAFLWIAVQPMREYRNLSARDKFLKAQQFPALDAPELFRRAQKFQKIINEAPVREDPLFFYKMIPKVYRLQGAHGRYETVAFGENFLITKIPKDDLMMRLQFMIPSFHLRLESMHQRYEKKHGYDVMQKVADANRRLLDRWSGTQAHEQPSLVSYASFWTALWKAYLQSVLLAIPFFILRLRGEELRIAVEFWRLLPISAAWFVTVFFYPRIVDPRKQLRLALQFASYALTACLSFAGAVTAKAADLARGGGGAKNERTSAWIAEGDLSVTLSSRIFSKYVVVHGKVVHPEPVSQSDITLAWKNGLFLELWGSTDFQGRENSGREFDATIGWSGRHLNLGISYFDLNPLVSDEGGDTVRPYAEIFAKREFGERLSLVPYFKGEYMVVTENTGENSAGVLSAGIRSSWKPLDRLQIDQGFRFVGNGPLFRADPGLLARYDLGVNITLTDRIVLSPFILRLFHPLAGIKDRSFEPVFGAGVSARFH